MKAHYRISPSSALTLATLLMVPLSRATEYEIHGKIREEIRLNGPDQKYAVEFTVYVRDRGWLIQTTAIDDRGQSWQRQVGSTNGEDIYEVQTQGGQVQSPRPAIISQGVMPVEFLDMGMNGHLWLMFASGCYWTNLHSEQLRPVYDWHASVGVEPDLKVPAAWELLNGPGSLPREVKYLGGWGQTNGLYRVTGTESGGGMLVPNGFIFEEFQVGPINEKTFTREMIVRKRVEAEVTSFQPICSRQNLVPVRGAGDTDTVDLRLKEPGSSHIPTYRLAHDDGWPSVEQARHIVEANSKKAR
jgi:hypothetical protein